MQYKLYLNDVSTIEIANGNCSLDFLVFLDCINFFIAALTTAAMNGHIKVHFYASVLFTAVKRHFDTLKCFFFVFFPFF